jgi:hypothetical protein
MRDTVEMQPQAETSLSLYFKERISDCAREVDPPPAEDTCWYVSALLERFGRSEDFFAFEEGRLGLRPLALLYGDAMEARSSHERCLLLQQLGDMALFLGALFPEQYSRRGIRQDYLVGMGGGAYDYLASNARAGRHVFAELATTFTVMLDLVAKACHADPELGAEAVLALYERWLRTQNPLAERQLRAMGMDLPEPTALH